MQTIFIWLMKMKHDTIFSQGQSALVGQKSQLDIHITNLSSIMHTYI